jgi:hypothetical protein
MASPMITADPEINTSLKRKRVKTVYDVAPVMASNDFTPFFASTLEYADRLKSGLENHYRNHFNMTLDWDAMDPDNHISVAFTYAPSYLFEFAVTARDV